MQVHPLPMASCFISEHLDTAQATQKPQLALLLLYTSTIPEMQCVQIVCPWQCSAFPAVMWQLQSKP